MKIFNLIVTAVVLFGVSAWAEEKTTSLELALGYQSSYGVFGLGGSRFINPNQDLHVTLGADLNGSLFGLGSRWYTDPHKVKFIFESTDRYFAGATLVRTNGALATAESDGVHGEYKISDGLATNLTVGSREIYGDSFLVGVDLGYRLWMKRASVDFQSGTFLQKHQDDLEVPTRNSITLAVLIGWMF